MNLRKLQADVTEDSQTPQKHHDLTAVDGKLAFEIFAESFYYQIKPEDQEPEVELNFSVCLS